MSWPRLNSSMDAMTLKSLTLMYPPVMSEAGCRLIADIVLLHSQKIEACERSVVG